MKTSTARTPLLCAKAHFSSFTKPRLSHLLCLLLVSLFLANGPIAKDTWAAEHKHVGDILRFQGKVLIFSDGAVRATEVKKINTPIFVRDSVKTKRNSLCYIKFDDASKIILKQNSSLTIKGINHANVDNGAILFDIKKRGGVKGLNISSATITIGVKGTRFAVCNNKGNTLIYLKRGVIELNSDAGEFKHYGETLKEDYETFHKKLKEDFENTKEKLRADFEESKQRMQEGNIKYLKSFEMNAGSAISIDENNEVWKIDIPEWLEQDFSLFDNFETTLIPPQDNR